MKMYIFLILFYSISKYKCEICTEIVCEYFWKLEMRETMTFYDENSSKKVFLNDDNKFQVL